MKGINETIAIVLIVIIVVALIGLTYSFAIGFYNFFQPKQNAYDYMTNLGNSLTLFCNRTDNTTFVCHAELCFTTGSSENFCQDTNETAIFKLVSPYR